MPPLVSFSARLSDLEAALGSVIDAEHNIQAGQLSDPLGGVLERIMLAYFQVQSARVMLDDAIAGSRKLKTADKKVLLAVLYLAASLGLEDLDLEELAEPKPVSD